MLTPNPTDDRLKFILKTYGAKKPWVVAGMVRVIASTIGDDGFYGSLLDEGGDFGLASVYRDARRAPLNVSTTLAESLVAAAMARPRFRERHAGDPLFPWMAQQLAKVDAVATSTFAPFRQLDSTHPGPFTALLDEFERRGTLLVQWYKATRPNLGQFDSHSAFNTAEDWKEENRESGPVPQGEVVVKLADKWTAQKLTTPEQLDVEGERMQHCVGSYAKHVADGKTTIYSLRDATGHPHVTIEVARKKVIQIRGKQNEKPAEKYEKYVEEFKKWLSADGVRTGMKWNLKPIAMVILEHDSDAVEDSDDEESEELEGLAQSWFDAVHTAERTAKWMSVGFHAHDYSVVSDLELENVTPEEFATFPVPIRAPIESNNFNVALIEVARMEKVLKELSGKRDAELGPAPQQALFDEDSPIATRVPGQDPRERVTLVTRGGNVLHRHPSLKFGYWDDDYDFRGRHEDFLWLYPAEEWLAADFSSDPTEKNYVGTWFLRRFSSVDAEKWFEAGVPNGDLAADLRRRRVTLKLIEELVRKKPRLDLSKMDGIDVIDALEEVGLQRNGKRASRRRTSKRTSRRRTSRRA